MAWATYEGCYFKDECKNSDHKMFDSNDWGACKNHVPLTMFEGEPDAVNHPTHYNQGDIEWIDAMVSAFGVEKVAVFCRINAFKYVWRMANKNGLEDAKKAVWYLNKHIELKERMADDSD